MYKSVLYSLFIVCTSLIMTAAPPASACQLSKRQIEESFQTVDYDRSKAISLGEYMSFAMSYATRPDDPADMADFYVNMFGIVKANFDRQDRNRDGELTINEYFIPPATAGLC